MRELTVGYLSDSYRMRRSALAVAPYCSYVPVGDWYRMLARSGRLLNRVAGCELIDVHDVSHQFRERRLSAPVDLLHLFNQVSYGTLPWISSFETALPRLRILLHDSHGAEPSFERAIAHPKVARAFGALAAQSCRRLLALSQCAANTQNELLSAVLSSTAPRWRERIARKITVLPPPQAKLVPHIAAKPNAQHRPLRLLFVGGGFCRKGGVELIETLLPMVRKQRRAFELTIVSNLSLDSNAAEESAAERSRVRGLITAHRDWIRHYDALNNAAVVQLMRRADVGVLPTYADSYGFVVLEFQAAGCPVITTDVRGLPEINDDSRGWLINVPKDRFGEARYATGADRARLSRAIRAGLAHCLQQICAQPELARSKGECALRAIELRHDPIRIGEQLFDIYMQCAASRARGRGPPRPMHTAIEQPSKEW